MNGISDLYLLFNRDFLIGTRESSMRKILSMKANGKTYSSQIGPVTKIAEHVVGNFDVTDQTAVFVKLSFLEFLPLALNRTQLGEILDHMTFGWFEFEDGLKGAIAAHFGSLPIATSVQPPKPQSKGWRSVEFEGQTLEEAKKNLAANRPLLSAVERGTLVEKIVSDGSITVVRWHVHSPDAVDGKIRTLLPSHATVRSKTTIRSAGSESFVIEAQSRQEASMLAQQRLKGEFDSVDINEVVAPKRGVLGIGKGPGRYAVSASRDATVEVAYAEPVRIRLTWRQD
jgi:hypothetical protein